MKQQLIEKHLEAITLIHYGFNGFQSIESWDEEKAAEASAKVSLQFAVEILEDLLSKPDFSKAMLQNNLEMLKSEL
jgi:hypothetical protein